MAFRRFVYKTEATERAFYDALSAKTVGANEWKVANRRPSHARQFGDCKYRP
jgi:hypothetical protein